MSAASDKAERSNQRLWDELAPVHMRAYNEVARLRAGGSTLDEIELEQIGEVAGKRLLHLQCHIGTDTLSWARLGAEVTGVDFSEASLDCAQELQKELGLTVRWIHSNVYDLPEKLDERFDIVYTSRGVLCWLKDIEAWGRIVARYLEPGGRLYLMESHPAMDIMEEDPEGELKITLPYFRQKTPTLWQDDGPDYADSSYMPENPSYEWTWSLSDIFTALIDAGLVIEHFGEYDRLFFQRYPSMEALDERWYHLPRYAGKLPLMFTLLARKPA